MLRPPGRRPEPEHGSAHRSSQQDAPAIRPALITSALALIAGLGLFAPAGTCAEEAVEAPLAIESLLLDGAAAGSRLVVVGERGHILVSTDGGASWKQARVPTRALLTAVHLHDEHTGWAVGHDAVILRTGDGGATWEIVHHAPEEERPLLDVWFRDARTASRWEPTATSSPPGTAATPGTRARSARTTST